MRDHGGSIINFRQSAVCGATPPSASTTRPRPPSSTSPRSWPSSSGPACGSTASRPGLVKTDFARALWEPAGDAVAAGLPLRRLGEPEDIAHAARFLAGPGAAWITGHTLVVDGGALGGRHPDQRPARHVPEGRRGRCRARRSTRARSRVANSKSAKRAASACSSSRVQRWSAWIVSTMANGWKSPTSPPATQNTRPLIGQSSVAR